MKVGNIVLCVPQTGVEKSAQSARGQIVWVHPKGRFAMVEFKNGLRECFQPIDMQIVS